MDIIYDEKKNEKLFLQRGVTFSEVIDKIYNDEILLEMKHPNEKDYPHQRIFVVEINKYDHPANVPVS